MRKIVRRNRPPGRTFEMLAGLAIVFMFLIWVIVLWGASRFNQNVQ
jgi:hypothetical protein